MCRILAERADERLHRKTTVRMGIRVIQRTAKPPLPSTTMYNVLPSQMPSISLRIQGCKTRVESAENEIIEDDGWSRSAFNNVDYLLLRFQSLLIFLFPISVYYLFCLLFVLKFVTSFFNVI